MCPAVGSIREGTLSDAQIFLSYTSEMDRYPEARSLVTEAVEAVRSCGLVPVLMRDFTADPRPPAQLCIDRVRATFGYVGIIGFRYGTPVRERPELSYTELEFLTACEARLPRFVFLLDEDASLPGRVFRDLKFGERQVTFRERLIEAEGLTCALFRSGEELRELVRTALTEHLERVEDATTELELVGPRRRKWKADRPAEPRHELRGMDWYEEADSSLFFGRDGAVEECLKLLDEQSVILLHGESGVGKSSLVRAGLLPKLRALGRRGVVIRPHGRPATALAEELSAELLTADSEPFSAPFDSVVFRDEVVPLLVAGGCRELVLILDQIEDVVSRSAEAGALDMVVSLLREVRRGARLLPQIKAVAVYRSDASSALGRAWQQVSGTAAGLPYVTLSGICRRAMQETLGSVLRHGLIDGAVPNGSLLRSMRSPMPRGALPRKGPYTRRTCRSSYCARRRPATARLARGVRAT